MMSKISSRIEKLPEPIQKHVLPEDPYWCSLPPGWFDLVCKMNEHLEKLEPYYILHQVKEKFGGLRYYTHTPNRTNDRDDLFRVVVSYYETLSFSVCDQCGEPGTRWIKGGYVRTRCRDHSDGADPCEE